MALHKMMRLMTLSFAGEGYLSEPPSLNLSSQKPTLTCSARCADFMGNEVRLLAFFVVRPAASWLTHHLPALPSQFGHPEVRRFRPTA